MEDKNQILSYYIQAVTGTFKKITQNSFVRRAHLFIFFAFFRNALQGFSARDISNIFTNACRRFAGYLSRNSAWVFIYFFGNISNAIAIMIPNFNNSYIFLISFLIILYTSVAINS